MGDQQHRRGRAPQPVADEAEGAIVEVVGGLVEQEQIGSGEQQPGERHPGRLAAADLGDRTPQLGGAQAHAGEQGVALGRELPGGEGAEPLDDVAVLGDAVGAGQRLGVGGERVVPAVEPGPLSGACLEVLGDRPRRLQRGGVLAEVAAARVLRRGDRAADAQVLGWLGAAQAGEDGLEEAGLAAAVGTHQPDPASGLDAEAHPVDEGAPGRLQGEALDLEGDRRVGGSGHGRAPHGVVTTASAMGDRPGRGPPPLYRSPEHRAGAGLPSVSHHPARVRRPRDSVAREVPAGGSVPVPFWRQPSREGACAASRPPPAAPPWRPGRCAGRGTSSRGRCAEPR